MTPPDSQSWDTTDQSAQRGENSSSEVKHSSAHADSPSPSQTLSWRGVTHPGSTAGGNDTATSSEESGSSQQLRWRGADYSGSASADQDYLKRLETTAAGVVLANTSLHRGLSIRIKATALAVLFGVLPVLAVGALAYRSANRSITEQIVEQELEETDQLAGQLRQYLQERLANVKTVASLVQAFPVFETDLEDEERTRLKQELANDLSQFVEDYRTYASLAVFDRQGNVLVQSSGSVPEQNQFEADYFQQVLQTGTPVVSEPIPIASQGASQRLSVYAAAPVVGSSGNTEAVVAAQIPVDFIGNAILRNAISAEEEEEESEFYRLVDSSGKIFQSLPTDAENSKIGSAVADEIPGFDSVHEQRQLLGWVEPTPDWEALNVYAPVTGLGHLNWSVVTSSSTEDAFAPQRQLLQTLLLGSAITAIIAVLLGIYLAKRTTQPIERVAEAVEQLGQGQLDTRVTVRGNDELAVLGANVNRMARQVQILLRTLRQNTEQLGLQNDVLAGLARNEALMQGDAQGAAQAFTEAIAHTLSVERVSVWLYEREPGTMVCLTQYQRSTDRHSSGALLNTEPMPEYVKAITNSQFLAAESVSRDEIAQELVAQNALAADTVSLLEMPIQIAGALAGSLRCEHSGQLREWQAEEQTFVSSVANLVALALESEFLQGEVSHLLDVVSAVEEGNLVTQARVSDRTTGLVADTFNRLIERLSEVLRQAIDTTQQVAASANQQKSQASLIAANAEQQADGVNQVLQLTARVQTLAQETADRIETSRASLQTLQKTVEEGQETMATLTTGIGILQEGSDRIIQQMKTLGEFVGLADQFVQDQTQIASLTQTLALNASLVAARAAEQRDPRQFAVAAREFSSIASQVSQLAQQTNASLTTLEQRSAQIQSVVFTVDANVQRVGSLVKDFTHGVEQSNRVFADVQSVTVEAVNAEAVVAQASQEIISAVRSATDVAGIITDIAAQTAELTQDNRMQAEQMETLSHQLLDTMVFFQLPTSPDQANQANRAQLQQSAISTENTLIVASRPIPANPATADPM